ILPSAPTAIHESSRRGSMWDGCVPNGPCAPALGRTDAAPNDTIRTPDVLRKSRREKPARSKASCASGVTLHLLPVARDRAKHADVREASAQHRRHGLPQLGVGRFRVLIQKRFRRENHAAQAEPALSRLFLDERLLKGMRMLGGPKPFKSGDLRAVDSTDGCNARPYGTPAGEHRAGAALSKSATKLRPSQSKVVAQDVEQRSRGIDINRVTLPIDDESDRAHGVTREERFGLSIQSPSHGGLSPVEARVHRLCHCCSSRCPAGTHAARRTDRTTNRRSTP